MKTIYLLRHAKSSWSDAALEDFDRPLGKRGRQAAKAVAKYLAKHDIAPDHVLCSSARRTRETLELVHRGMGAAVPVRFEKGVYMAEAAALLRRLRRLNDSLSSVMLVGHNPGLERLALALISPAPGGSGGGGGGGGEGGSEVGGGDGLRQALAAKFPTGALAVIEARIDRWHDLAPATARLTAFVKPKDLEPAGKE